MIDRKASTQSPHASSVEGRTYLGEMFAREQEQEHNACNLKQQ
jgi:hypothetical protein